MTGVGGGAVPAPGREQIAGGLRQVCQRAAGMPEGERRRAMELFLAFQMRTVERAQVPARLQEVLEQLAVGPAQPVHRPEVEARKPEEPSRGLEPGGGEAARSLEELVERIRSLAGYDADPALSPEALLEQVRARAAAVEQSVKDTAQEFFDRLLQALDPDAARAFVGKPGLRPAPMYKAAVFDAYAEKFSQLAEYHQKGRLVRDFRASFKRNLRG